VQDQSQSSTHLLISLAVFVIVAMLISVDHEIASYNAVEIPKTWMYCLAATLMACRNAYPNTGVLDSSKPRC
jgi:hypothetical protein